MEHMQYLVVRSHNADGQPFHHPMERADDIEHDHMSGHALMATCPPYSHVMEKPGEPYPHQMPQGMSKPDLRRLLELSARLPTEGGEITPVRAWMQIQSNERCSQMTKQDFELVQADLLSKVRCYGYVLLMTPSFHSSNYISASVPCSKNSRSPTPSTLSSLLARAWRTTTWELRSPTNTSWHDVLADLFERRHVSDLFQALFGHVQGKCGSHVQANSVDEYEQQQYS